MSDQSNKHIAAKRGQTAPSENQCPICLERISNRSRTDPCSHEFCLQCLRHWSNDHNFCPVCRQVFDRIQYNFRDNNHFDSIPVDNRQSRVRRSLFAQRDALRESLNRTRVRVDQQMETLRQRLREREEARNRVGEHLLRINSIDRQNNDEIDQTLNQVRNAINEINYHNFVEGVSDPRPLDLLVPQINSLIGHNLLPIQWNDNQSDSLTVNQSASTGSPSQRSDLSGNDTDSENSGPTSVEWRIFGPNSLGTVSVSSHDSSNGSVRSINAVLVSHSTPESPNQDLSNLENISLNRFLNESPFSRAVDHNLLSHMNELEQTENRANHMFENIFNQNISDIFGQSSSFATNQGPSNRRQTGTPRIVSNRPGYTSARTINENRQTHDTPSNRRRPYSFNNSILQRNMDFMNQLNQSQRSSNQRINESDSDSD